MRRLIATGIAIITMLLVNMTAFAAQQPAATEMSQTQIEAIVDEVMQEHIGVGAPGAAVAIVKDGQVELLKGYGLADIENNKPVDPANTVFEIGSVTKLFTWSAVMQLVEQGELDLDADIREYLPEGFLKKLTYPDKITMRHLMNHTAGFEERLDSLYVMSTDRLMPLGEFLSHNRQPKQIYRPGTTIAYSNFSSSLAGYIVERVSGVPYNNYIQQNILSPLDMKQSTVETVLSSYPELMQNKNSGYVVSADGFAPAPAVYFNDVPAGSINATAENMAHFLLAQLDDKGNVYKLFEKPETLSEMHTQSFTHHPQLPGNSHGFWEGLAGDIRYLQHGGNTIGFTSIVVIVPEYNLGLCVLTNVAQESVGIRTALIEKLIGASLPEKPIQNMGFSHASEVAGTYRTSRVIENSFASGMFPITKSDFTVTSNSQGGITISGIYCPTPVDYVETSPYFFEKVNDEEALMEKMGVNMSRIVFTVDGQGKVTNMAFGIISDYIPVKGLYGYGINLWLIRISLGILAACIVVFLIRCAVNLIQRKKHTLAPLSSGYKTVSILSAVGLLVSLNTQSLLTRFMGDPTQAASGLNWHILVNWTLPLALVISIPFVIRSLMCKEGSILEKALQICVVLAAGVLVALLCFWKLLVLA